MVNERLQSMIDQSQTNAEQQMFQNLQELGSETDKEDLDTIFGEFGVKDQRGIDVIGNPFVPKKISKKQSKRTTLQEIDYTKGLIARNKKELISLELKLEKLISKARKEVEVLNKEIKALDGSA